MSSYIMIFNPEHTREFDIHVRSRVSWISKLKRWQT